MQITVSCARLAPELALARRVTERKSTIPVYAFARLDALDGELRIVSTDGESAFVTQLPATVDAPGCALVPVRTLAEIVRAAASADLSIALVKDRVKVTCGSYAATLSTYTVDDFPMVPEFPHAGGVPLVSASFAEALGRVRPFIQGDGSIAATHGAYVSVADGVVDVVATDKHRLGHATLSAPADAAAVDLLIPRKAVEDLAAILETASEGEVVDVARDQRRGYFRLGARLYVCALMDLQFLNYKRLIANAGGDTILSVDRDALLGCLRRVRLVADPKSIAVDFDIQRKALTATMEGASTGSAVEEVPISLDKGAPFTVRFAGDYLAEFLEVIPPGPVTLSINPNTQPIALLKGESPFAYVVAAMVQ